MDKLKLHLKMFNDKVKLMNQTQSKDLTLSAQEARNIHSDLFELLNYCSFLNIEIKKLSSNQPNVVEVSMDGGVWDQDKAN